MSRAVLDGSPCLGSIRDLDELPSEPQPQGFGRRFFMFAVAVAAAAIFGRLQKNRIDAMSQRPPGAACND